MYLLPLIFLEMISIYSIIFLKWYMCLGCADYKSRSPAGYPWWRRTKFV